MNLRLPAAWAMVVGGAIYAALLVLTLVTDTPDEVSLQFLFGSQILVMVGHVVPAGARWVRDLQSDPAAPYPRDYTWRKRG